MSHAAQVTLDDVTQIEMPEGALPWLPRMDEEEEVDTDDPEDVDDAA